MRRVVVAAAVLATSAAAPVVAAKAPQLSEAERAFCEAEVDVVERRERVFSAQGLSPEDVDRRNDAQLRELSACRERFRRENRRAMEEKEDLAETARRAGPHATELEREKVMKEVRLERLASKSSSSLTPEEKAELAAGMAQELATTSAARDAARARDPAFMRIVHSALACYHGPRRDDLRDAISSEQAMLKLGSGDKQRLYGLKSQLRESETIYARSAEAGREFPGGLERCTSAEVAFVAHCFGLRAEGRPSEPACESDEIQQYIRLLR